MRIIHIHYIQYTGTFSEEISLHSAAMGSLGSVVAFAWLGTALACDLWDSSSLQISGAPWDAGDLAMKNDGRCGFDVGNIEGILTIKQMEK